MHVEKKNSVKQIGDDVQINTYNVGPDLHKHGSKSTNSKLSARKSQKNVVRELLAWLFIRVTPKAPKAPRADEVQHT